jgi:hypothetical protein
LEAADVDEWSGRDRLWEWVIRRGIFSPAPGAALLQRAIPEECEQSAQGVALRLVAEDAFQMESIGRYELCV